MTACGYWRWNSRSSWSERRQVCESAGRGGGGASSSWASVEQRRPRSTGRGRATGRSPIGGPPNGRACRRAHARLRTGQCGRSVRADGRPVEVDRPVVERVVVLGGPVAQPLKHGPRRGQRPPSRSESTNEAPPNSAMPDAWSKWRCASSRRSRCSASRSLALPAGRAGPRRAQLGRPAWATRRPMLAEGFEVTDGCSPVSTTKWPAVRMRDQEGGAEHGPPARARRRGHA